MMEMPRHEADGRNGTIEKRIFLPDRILREGIEDATVAVQEWSETTPRNMSKSTFHHWPGC
jgi:hypothetical protein